jgi:hypothetical protein
VVVEEFSKLAGKVFDDPPHPLPPSSVICEE